MSTIMGREGVNQSKSMLGLFISSCRGWFSAPPTLFWESIHPQPRLLPAKQQPLGGVQLCPPSSSSNTCWMLPPSLPLMSISHLDCKVLQDFSILKSNLNLRHTLQDHIVCSPVAWTCQGTGQHSCNVKDQVIRREQTLN